MNQDILSLTTDMDSIETALNERLEITINELVFRYEQYCDDFILGSQVHMNASISDYCKNNHMDVTFVELNLLFNFCYQTIYKHEHANKFFHMSFPISKNDTAYSGQHTRGSHIPTNILSAASYPSDLCSMLLQHVIICSYYSLLDQHSKHLKQKYAETSLYNQDIRRIQSIQRDLPENIITTYAEKGNGIYYRDFLCDFDKTLLEEHAFQANRKIFLNHKPNLEYNQTKELNQRIQEIIRSLMEYGRNLYIPINQKASSFPEIEKVLYVYKLESIFDVSFFDMFLRRFTYESLPTQSEQPCALGDIYKLFCKIQSVFARTYLLDSYLNRDYSLNDIEYIVETLIPLLTNTFFCMINKLYSNDSIKKLESYIKYCLTEPDTKNRFNNNSGSGIHPYYNWNNVRALISDTHSKTLLYDEPIASTYAPDTIAPGMSLKEVVTAFLKKHNDDDKRAFFECVIKRYTKTHWIIPNSNL